MSISAHKQYHITTALLENSVEHTCPVHFAVINAYLLCVYGDDDSAHVSLGRADSLLWRNPVVYGIYWQPQERFLLLRRVVI